nr:MAG TPA: hypothetical protein [Caudoviricetes sp.]
MPQKHDSTKRRLGDTRQSHHITYNKLSLIVSALWWCGVNILNKHRLT